jgi:alpha-ribazole phosphatase
MDFGAWDGRRWSDISREAFDRWMSNFCSFDFDGGESLNSMLARVAAWQPSCALVVGHGGWISARQWRGGAPTPASWPLPLRYAASLSSDF